MSLRDARHLWLCWGVAGVVVATAVAMAVIPSGSVGPPSMKLSQLLVAASHGPYAETMMEDIDTRFSSGVETLINEVISIPGIVPEVMLALSDASQSRETVLVEVLTRVRPDTRPTALDIEIFRDRIKSTAIGNVVRLVRAAGTYCSLDESSARRLCDIDDDDRHARVLRGLSQWNPVPAFVSRLAASELAREMGDSPDQLVVASLLRALSSSSVDRTSLELCRSALRRGHMAAMAPLAQWGDAADHEAIRKALSGDSAFDVAWVLSEVRDLPASLERQIQGWISSKNHELEVSSIVFARGRIDRAGWRDVVNASLASSDLRSLAVVTIYASNPDPDSE